MLDDLYHSSKNKSIYEWVSGSALVWAGKQFVFQAPRRGIRYSHAFTKGVGRHLHASYKTLGDFHKATRLGNTPFAVERHIMPAAAMGVVLATPVGMIAAVSEYPEIAGPQQQSAATGQIGIGSRAGQQLIFGSAL